jgi:7-carboxy-7-deazaguanine synthase
MADDAILVNEIFYSIQGESTWSGLPCSFIRLRGCPLRCHYCDTSYAFAEGDAMLVETIVDKVVNMPTRLVEITGGEPLLQPNVHKLITQLLDQGFEVLLETSGERDISSCDARVYRIIDIKTPDSGAGSSFMHGNFGQLSMLDEVKFVIMTREDFDWALQLVESEELLRKVKAVHFSPVMEQESTECIKGSQALPPEELSKWILDCGLPIRMHLQVHKYIWSPDAKGV